MRKPEKRLICLPLHQDMEKNAVATHDLTGVAHRMPSAAALPVAWIRPLHSNIVDASLSGRLLQDMDSNCKSWLKTA